MSTNDGDEPHHRTGHLDDAETLNELQQAADFLARRSKEAQLRRPPHEESGLALVKALNQEKRGLKNVLRSLPKQQDREDALQEVALRASVSLKNGTIEPTVERIVPVLYLIARNVRNDFFGDYNHRGAGRETPIDLDDDQSLDFASLWSEGSHTVDSEMAFKSLLAVAKLGLKEERALRYKFIDDLTPLGMSERYGDPANSWSVALTAALKKIRKGFKEEWHD